MFGGMGSAEFLIIIAIVLLLFGPTLLAFWLGYVVGQRKSEQRDAPEAGDGEESASTPVPGEREGPGA